MNKPFDERLGSRFWFALGMFVFALCAFGYGLSSGQSGPIFGGAFFALLYGYELIERVRKVSFTKRLKRDPEMLRIYAERQKK